MKPIKSYCLFFIPALVMLLVGCKKNEMQSSPGKKAMVTTIAGDGRDLEANGPVLSASFHTPIALTVATDGSLYVADYNGHRIRKVAGGQVSTFAGSDSTGIVNGGGELARFKNPFRMKADGNGNLYVLDQLDPRVRKIGPDGYVTTFAGNPVPGFSDGPAFQAQFQVNAEGIAADGQGNIYVGDTFNERIRKINTAAQVNTLAGDGMEGFRDGDAGSAEFRFPGAIVFDKQGNLYVWDYGNYCIRKITPAGVVSKFSGSGENGYEDGNASQAKFHVVFDMVADSEGNLYVADDNRIRKVTPTGSVSTIAGGSTAGYRDGEGTIARFALPSGLAIDEEGNIYVADANNNRIRKISFQ